MAEFLCLNISQRLTISTRVFSLTLNVFYSVEPDLVKVLQRFQPSLRTETASLSLSLRYYIYCTNIVIGVSCLFDFHLLHHDPNYGIRDCDLRHWSKWKIIHTLFCANIPLKN